VIICESYVFEFSINRDIKKEDIRKEVAVGKVTAHLCLTLLVKELKIHDFLKTLSLCVMTVLEAFEMSIRKW